MAIYKLGELVPDIAEGVFVAESASVIGNVTLGAGVSVWPGAVIRGDNDRITIGANVNIQDGAVIHADVGEPTTIGENVTIGHQAMLHGCTIGARALIGIQAVVLNGAVIGEGCLVGAGALVTEGKQFEAGALIVGAPARVVRPVTDEMRAVMSHDNADYVRRAGQYRQDLERIDWGGGTK